MVTRSALVGILLLTFLFVFLEWENINNVFLQETKPSEIKECDTQVVYKPSGKLFIEITKAVKTYFFQFS